MSKVFNYFTVCLMCLSSVDAWAAINGLLKERLEENFGKVHSAQTCVNVWQYSTPYPIQASGEDHPCIGSTRDDKGNCKQNTTACFGDEWGINVLVATKVAYLHGFMFCPRSVIARNSDWRWSWTQYHMPYWGDCHVLCAPGFTGEFCNKNMSDNAFCDTSKMNWQNYNGLTLSNVCDGRVYNNENSVFNWWANYAPACPGGWLGKEHDLVLAVADWLDSGHGAWVRPYVMYANQNDVPGNYSWITVGYGLQTDNTKVPRQLWCKRGYKPNADNTDCVAINQKVCDLQWCGTWDSRKFDSKKFTLNTDRSCMQWRCIDTTQALSAPGSTECSACVESARDGVNPEDGTCIHCGTGKVFDQTADTTGYCAETTAVTKTQMKYGPYGSKDSKIQDQCWTFDNDKKYQICITEGAEAAAKYVPDTSEPEE